MTDKEFEKLLNSEITMRDIVYKDLQHLNRKLIRLRKHIRATEQHQRPGLAKMYNTACININRKIGSCIATCYFWSKRNLKDN